MRPFTARTSFFVALAISTALTTPAFAEAPAKSGDVSVSAADIVVTARRSTERLQDVPVAVTVLSQATIDQRGVFNPIDLATTTPGLEVTASVADRNNLTYSIRGEGYTYGTLFPAVVTYFNEVPIAQLTQGQFFDLANVQILRGPQGVQFGRVTDGGNVLLTPQAPKNNFGGYLEAKLGNYGLRTVSGAINVPILGDKILFRGSFSTDRRDGFTTNIASGLKLDNVASDSYRGVLTLHPIDALKNVTTVAYQHTSDNGTSGIFEDFNTNAVALPGAFGLPTLAGLLPLYGLDAKGNVVYKFTGAPGTSPLIPGAAGLTPLTVASYEASILAQLAAQKARGVRQVDFADATYDRRTNLYITNVTTLDLPSNIQLKNVFGYVTEKDDEAQIYAPVNGRLVTPCHSSCGTGGSLPVVNQKQVSDELRLSGKSLNNSLTWALGGYLDQQSPNGPSENDGSSLGILQRDGVALITSKSRAVYGSAEYAVTNDWKINGGIRYTHDTVHSETNTYTFPTFLPVPHGLCQNYLGTNCVVLDQAFDNTSWTLGSSYKVDKDKLVYAKISTGYRPGGVNGTAPTGVSPVYNPERDTSIELGIKADWHFGDVFARTNLALYRDRYKGIQKLNVLSDNGTPTTLVQNVAAATVQGVEFEGTLIPVKGLKFGATAAYTSAKYDQNHGTGPTNGQTLAEATTNPTSPCNPSLFVNLGFCTDNHFPGTPEFQWTLSADYSYDLGRNIGEFNIGGTLYNQSSIYLNDTTTLNPNSNQAAYSLVNMNAGLHNAFGQPLDLSFFVTNLTDKTYRIGTNDLSQTGSIGTRGSIYAAPRMWGFSMKFRFGSDAK